MTAKFYEIEGSPPIVLKMEGHSGWVYRDGKWEESAWALAKASGIGGDAEAQEISEAEAMKLIAKGAP